MTFEERCRLSEQCLPEAPYREMLTKLHDEMLEALAQPQQEPLEYWNAVEGWVKIEEAREHLDSVGCGTIYKTAGEGRVPLCIAQPQQEPVVDLQTRWPMKNWKENKPTPAQRKPLTDEEIWRVAANCLDSIAGRMQFARAIEAAHGITAATQLKE